MILIDADEARENMLKLLDHHLMMRNYSADSATQDCIEVINEATVVDAEPVVHGHWILEREPNGKPYCFHCSVCDDDFHYIGIKSATGYCPNCGAKMDEKGSEERDDRT